MTTDALILGCRRGRASQAERVQHILLFRALMLFAFPALVPSILAQSARHEAYSADVVIQAIGVQGLLLAPGLAIPQRSKLLFSQGKLRWEGQSPDGKPGQNVVIVADLVAGTALELHPDTHEYYNAQDSPAELLGLMAEAGDPCELAKNSLGSEVKTTLSRGERVNGRTADLCDARSVDSENAKQVELKVWVDPDLGVAIRREEGFLQAGMIQGARMDVTNIREGPQAATLFEIPTGYRDGFGEELRQPLPVEFAGMDPFSADFVTPEGTNKIYGRQGMMRIEFQGAILLADFAALRFLLLDPVRKTYRDGGASFRDWFQFFQPLNPDRPCEKVKQFQNPGQCVQVGPDTFQTYRSPKTYSSSMEKFELRSPQGTVIGYVDIDRTVGLAVRDVRGGRTFRELDNLKIGAQPEGLFAIPADYRESSPGADVGLPSGEH